MKAADPAVDGQDGVGPDAVPARATGRAGHPVAEMAAGLRLRAALAGVLIALVAAALCGLAGVLLAQAFFGTTGGIL